MAGEREANERIVDLDDAGDALPDLIEDAARRGERLVVERGGVRLAVIVPAIGTAGDQPSDAGRDRLADASFRAGFAGPTDEEIQRETVRTIAQVRTGARPVSDDDLRAVLAAVRANFADQSDEDIERETAKALAEARADLRAERSGMRKAS